MARIVSYAEGLQHESSAYPRLLSRMQAGQDSKAPTWPTTQITLLHRVADRRDKASWDSFVQIYGPLIHRYCLRRGVQEADAFDVVQDVLLQVSKGIGSFQYDAERGRFRNWLGTVTHRAMLKHQAKSQRAGVGAGNSAGGDSQQENMVEQSLDEGWVESFNAHIYREAVRRLQLQFSEETWRAFEAIFVEDRPPCKVATELGRSIGWVYQAKSQIVRRLREEILYLAEDSTLLN